MMTELDEARELSFSYAKDAISLSNKLFAALKKQLTAEEVTTLIAEGQAKVAQYGEVLAALADEHKEAFRRRHEATAERIRELVEKLQTQLAAPKP